MRCSSDLRKRVIEFVAGGGSKAEAAQRFQVSRGSIYNWLKSEDISSYKRPGPKGARKLDLEELDAHVQAFDDMTQAERARHFGVSRHCVWYNLRRLKISRKKNDALQAAQPYEKEGVSEAS